MWRSSDQSGRELRHRQTPARRGFTLLTTALSLTVVMAMLALGIDLSLKYLVDAELQNAADAAAMSGADALRNGSKGAGVASAVYAAAESGGEANPTTGSSVQITASDVQVGWWDVSQRTFTASAANEPSNAVRATVTRSAQRGTAIPTMLANTIGVTQMKSSRTAVAMYESVPNYALIGVDRFTSAGILTVTDAASNHQGNVASNGTVKLNLLGLIGVTWIDGHVATSGSVECPAIGILTKIRDGVVVPEKPFVLPTVSTRVVDSQNDNANLGSLIDGNGNLNIVGIGEIYSGTYCVKNINVLAGALLRIHGPVTIYVKGDVNIVGTVLVIGDNPSHFRVRVASSGTVTIAAGLSLAMDLYAPQSAILSAAGVSYRGRMIGKTIDILGTTFFVLSTDLPQPELGRERVTIVK